MEIEIDFSKIEDWGTFHEVFAEEMGFPDFYGKNNNAWIDCMSFIDDKNSGMSKITVKHGESLNIIITGTEKTIGTAYDVLEGFIEIVAIVNQRFIESSTTTRLKIVVT